MCFFAVEFYGNHRPPVYITDLVIDLLEGYFNAYQRRGTLILFEGFRVNPCALSVAYTTLHNSCGLLSFGAYFWGTMAVFGQIVTL